jgi:hypothetical protein
MPNYDVNFNIEQHDRLVMQAEAARKRDELYRKKNQRRELLDAIIELVFFAFTVAVDLILVFLLCFVIVHFIQKYW